MKEFKKHFGWINKLSPYELKYTHSNDCKRWGCPSHIAKFTLNHAMDTFMIELAEETINLDGTEFAMILDFAERLTN
jgi:hypothetical protein